MKFHGLSYCFIEINVAKWKKAYQKTFFTNTAENRKDYFILTVVEGLKCSFNRGIFLQLTLHKFS